MKLTKLALATTLAVGLMGQGAEAFIMVDSVGTNITNLDGNGNVGDGINTPRLVPFVYSASLNGFDYAPSSSNADERLDWLNNVTGGNYEPGQVAGYNGLTSDSLAQPGDSVIQDGDGSGNSSGYSLPGGMSYYVTAHYGGSYVVWFVEGSDSDTFQVPSSIGGVTGANTYAASNDPDTGNYNPNQGLSNVRVWKGGRTNVPETGASLLLLGMGCGLLGLAYKRQRKA